MAVMAAEVGQVVVHPGHGLARIVDTETRQVRGVARDYLVLEMLEPEQSGTVVRIPSDTWEACGMRPPMDLDACNTVLEMLRGPDSGAGVSWVNRHRANVAKANSRQPAQLAEVVRDLTRLQVTTRLSPEDKKMLATATSILATEISVVFDGSLAHAQQAIETALHG